MKTLNQTNDGDLTLGRPRIVILALLTAAIVLLSYYLFWRFYFDDSLISLRYWQNFLKGEGLVWNPTERVEGYTNFLFLVVSGLISTLGFDLIESTRFVGLASLAGLVGFTAYYQLHHPLSEPGRRSLRLLPVLLVTTSLPLIIWSVGGLETVSFTWLASMACWLAAARLEDRPSRGVLVGILFALTTMTRPDGVIFLAVTAGFILLLSFKERKKFSFLVSMLASFAVFYVPYFLWRMWYYGDLLPNTFYVKGEFAPYKLLRGFEYITDFAVSPPYLLPLFLVGFGFALVRRVLDRRTLYLGLVVFGFMAWVLYVGGDQMPAYRFMVPMIPTLALLVPALLERLVPLTARYAFATSGMFLLFSFWYLGVPAPLTAKAWREHPAAFIGKAVAQLVNAHWPEGSLIALNTAGSTPFYASNYSYIDMLGLNDRHIAKRPLQDRDFPWKGVPGHEKGDGLYVLSRQPDYIILGPANGTHASTPWFLSDVEIAESAEFRRSYKYVERRVDITRLAGWQDFSPGGNIWFRFYRRIKTEE